MTSLRRHRQVANWRECAILPRRHHAVCVHSQPQATPSVSIPSRRLRWAAGQSIRRSGASSRLPIGSGAGRGLESASIEQLKRVPCHIFGDRGLTNVDADFEEFAMDSGSAPVGQAHCADQLADFERHFRSAAAMSRLPSELPLPELLPLGRRVWPILLASIAGQSLRTQTSLLFLA
jgi:hypothetical protein